LLYEPNNTYESPMYILLSLYTTWCCKAIILGMYALRACCLSISDVT
jgi:hypothetical protein